MKIIKIEDKLLTFDNGITIGYYHVQDCCESVYADFKQLHDTGILGKNIDKIKIEQVNNSGFRLNGFFVPCYNEQNGYYGSDLTLVIRYPDGRKEEIDISEAVEDKID